MKARPAPETVKTWLSLQRKEMGETTLSCNFLDLYSELVSHEPDYACRQFRTKYLLCSINFIYRRWRSQQRLRWHSCPWQPWRRPWRRCSWSCCRRRGWSFLPRSLRGRRRSGCRRQPRPNSLYFSIFQIFSNIFNNKVLTQAIMCGKLVF